MNVYCPRSSPIFAVHARQEGVDPVGACVGMRGVRIQNVVNELGGEKIDVVEWNEEPGRYVANALSPAQVVKVTVDEETKTATVVVPERQLSLAIGKEGQNARLAAKLTGWRIDIKSDTAVAAEQAAAEQAPAPSDEVSPEVSEASPEEREEAGASVVAQAEAAAKTPAEVHADG